MLKIRLRRMGAIRQPHYRIVVADARAPRDGAFVDMLGSYNPLTDPATINIDVTRYEEWKKKGAQPTPAVASLVKRNNRAVRLGTQAATPLTKKAQRAQARAVEAESAAATPATSGAADVSDTAGTGDEMAQQALAGGDQNITTADAGPFESGTQLNVPVAETSSDGEVADGLAAGTGTGPGGQTGNAASNTSHHG